jgi:hypothetical protein
LDNSKEIGICQRPEFEKTKRFRLIISVVNKKMIIGRREILVTR